MIHNWRWNVCTHYANLEVARTRDTCWSVAQPQGLVSGVGVAAARVRRMNFRSVRKRQRPRQRSGSVAFGSCFSQVPEPITCPHPVAQVWRAELVPSVHRPPVTPPFST